MDEQLDHDAVETTAEDPGWPVGFLVISGLTAIYLVLRLIQLGARFFDWLA